MIKLMRDASHNYPWLLKSLMGIIALAFVITMGWWGFGEQTGNPAAGIAFDKLVAAGAACIFEETGISCAGVSRCSRSSVRV